MFVSHTKHTQRKINGSTLFALDNMYYVNSEYKNKRVYLSAVKFKTKDQKYLGKLLIFTPISLVPKKCGLSIGLYVYVQGRIRQWLTLTYKIISFPYKILYASFLITDYLIGLAFWAISIGFQYVAWSGTKREQIRHQLQWALDFFVNF